MEAAKLSHDDVRSLMADRSVDGQIGMVERLAAHFSSSEEEHGFNAQETIIASDIFRLLLSRAETQVRSTLAKCLSNSHKLPPDIARKMVADVSEVASPILEHSSVLTDDDLLKIIGGDGE
jgi:uncharacterized protein (DUF2336 family)